MWKSSALALTFIQQETQEILTDIHNVRTYCRNLASRPAIYGKDRMAGIRGQLNRRWELGDVFKPLRKRRTQCCVEAHRCRRRSKPSSHCRGDTPYYIYDEHSGTGTSCAVTSSVLLCWCNCTTASTISFIHRRYTIVSTKSVVK